MVLPRRERVQRRKVDIEMLARLGVPPYAPDVHPHIVVTQIYDLSPAGTIADDTADPKDSIKYPDSDGDVQPVLGMIVVPANAVRSVPDMVLATDDGEDCH